CRREFLVVDGCGSGRELDTGREPAVDHEPGGERDISLIVPVAVTDVADVPGTTGVEPPEHVAADGAVGCPGLQINTLRDRFPIHLIGGRVEVGPKTGHIDLDGSARGVPTKDMDDRDIRADAV